MAPANRKYVLAVADAALDGLVTGVWIAAGELPPAGRRAVRLGASAAVAAVGYAAARKSPEVPVPTAAERAAQPVDKRMLIASAAVLGVSGATVLARRRLERRWTARLASQGHPHPTRVLAVRLGTLAFAAALLRRLIATRPGVITAGPGPTAAGPGPAAAGPGQ